MSGASAGHATELRPAVAVAGQPYRRLMYVQRIDPAVLPDSLRHDEERQTLLVGTGVFTGVSARMRHYDVGGRKVLDSWLSARGSRPTGRIGSPLDRVRGERWNPVWSTELVDILSTLRHITQLEPVQASLLARVLAAPLIDIALTRRGVLEPPTHTAASRTPTPGDVLPGMEAVDGQEASPVEPLPPVQPDRPPTRLDSRPRRAAMPRGTEQRGERG